MVVVPDRVFRFSALPGGRSQAPALQDLGRSRNEELIYYAEIFVGRNIRCNAQHAGYLPATLAGQIGCVCKRRQ